ncbi:acyl-CoA dehydrogenase N-terminal domain-containing protein [Defluviimonas salinarum]|uniref:Acyl-CoA dehydrogenase family protein n=1 Tax=Defluviimonas salinarum TaxID=2992147 RepID=A0ABT3J8E9_9RHOB|nr:acyl-CoA dehydrogenase family protein [Defluviimonas salinarum]MCW3783654.1 acyl-CoA dehydrogenase family protein [Defluviimonas salinarum]
MPAAARERAAPKNETHMSQIVDRRDLDFVLFEMLEADRLAGRSRFSGYERTAITQILDTAQALAEEKFLPCAAEVDSNEPRFVDGRVEQPAATGAALSAWAEAGFFALTFDEEAGGLKRPRSFIPPRQEWRWLRTRRCRTTPS